MEKRLLRATVVLIAVLMLLAVLPVHGEEEIYEAVVRLHVLANSDSAEDQALKLQVRDAVLDVTVPLLQDCKSREEAERLLTAHAQDIRLAAQAAVSMAGKSEPVTLALGAEDYPTRSYDSVCFPSGEYLSLRVCIGEAQGKNWWCCLFPPLCLGNATVSASQAEDSFIAVGLTPSQYKVVTETERPIYKIRFKLLELFG